MSAGIRTARTLVAAAFGRVKDDFGSYGNSVDGVDICGACTQLITSGAIPPSVGCRRTLRLTADRCAIAGAQSSANDMARSDCYIRR